MRLGILFVTFVFVSFVSACSVTSESKTEEVRIDEISFEDSTKTNVNGEIVISDQDFNDNPLQTATSGKSSQETNQIAEDGSTISTAFDGHGNKTETRIFNNHPRLKSVMVKTFDDGRQQIYVYAADGRVINLPENQFENILESPSNQISSAAGIFQDYRRIKHSERVESQPLKPLPSSQFPIRQPQQVETVEETQPESAEPNQTDEKAQNLSLNKKKTDEY